MGMDAQPGSITLRHPQAVWVPIVVWVVCALAVVDAFVEGSIGYALRITLLVGTVAYIAYIGLARPSLQVDSEGLTIANVLHTNRIPFGALLDVRVGGLTSVVARAADAAERKITSWNAPGVPRRAPRQGRGQQSAPDPGRSEVESLIEKRWDAWKVENPRGSAESALSRHWNTSSLAIAGALLVLNIAIRLR